MFEFKEFFTRKHESVPFMNRKMLVWNRWYWVVQPPLVTIPYNIYHAKFQKLNWEKVPQNKPVIFAQTHRNAFMDSLACVGTESSQVTQLARGDAFSNKFFAPIFYFFHMLPIWRDRDDPDGDNQKKNDITFNTCYDLLAKNAIIGIYPEGDCVNENFVRPLKKGICRLAFGAEERYNFSLDIQIVPVGVTYTAASKFKKWALINFGDPIPVKEYIEIYQKNKALAINKLKERIEQAMKTIVLHIEKTPYYETKEKAAQIYARETILSEGRIYEPISKFLEEKKILQTLEVGEKENPNSLATLKELIGSYENLLMSLNFKENTFDKDKHHPLSIIFMLIYFIICFPIFIYGVLVNYIPYIIPQRLADKHIKQKIFHSSFKYVVGFPIMMSFYLIYFIAIWIVLGSILSAVIFLISFPIAGHIAFYYWYDLKKWRSILKFRRLKKNGNHSIIELIEKRTMLIQTLKNFQTEYGKS